MRNITTDVLICGGGISGLLAAKALLSLGLSVVCIEKRTGGIKEKKLGSDGRSTAILDPTVSFLKSLGIWETLLKKAQPLESLVICNLSTDKGNIDETCEFPAADLNLKTLGFNVPNDFFISELRKDLSDHSKFIYFDNVIIEQLVSRTNEVIVLTNQKQKISSKLLVGADGRESSVREFANIEKHSFDYCQQALVFSIKHELKHKAKSYEIYEKGGPCTLVPNKTTKDNGYYSSVVLVDRPNEIDTASNLDRKSFSSYMNRRTGMILGECLVQTEVKKFPIISQISKKFTGDRVILLAESAHIMPPIGAQGLNSSIRDIEILTELIATRKVGNKDFGNNKFLLNFEKARAFQIRSRMIGVHMLNKVSMYSSRPIIEARKLGLRTLDKNPTLRNFAMKLGMYEKTSFHL